MKPAPFDYVRPATIAEACTVLSEAGGGATVIAGGQTLMPLLTDPQWWVRYRTAQALQHLLAGGEAQLAKVRDAQEDRYARDILTQVMAERALGETQ